MGSKEALGDAATGAALGSVAGPWGTAIGAIGGGLYGLFDNSQSDADAAAARAQAQKIQALKEAGMKIEAYRPELRAMEEAGKQEQLGQFGATDSLLAAMMGGKPGAVSEGPMALGLRPAQGVARPGPLQGSGGPDRAISPMMLRNQPGPAGVYQGQVPITPLPARTR